MLGDYSVIPLSNINAVFFVMETLCVCCEVGTVFWYRLVPKMSPIDCLVGRRSCAAAHPATRRHIPQDTSVRTSNLAASVAGQQWAVCRARYTGGPMTDTCTLKSHVACDFLQPNASLAKVAVRQGSHSHIVRRPNQLFWRLRRVAPHFWTISSWRVLFQI
jgi:hypothetical protein